MPKLTLSNKLKSKGATAPKKLPPLWAGPNGEGPMGGITFSLLSRYLVCKERFRLYVIDRLKAADDFNQRIEYGNMWHACEEAFAASGNPIVNNPVANPPWQKSLINYCEGLMNKYPTQGSQIEHWYQVCKVQFPIYVEYWKKHPDVKNRTPLFQEETFDIPYALPGCREVRLRGKWDSVDLIKEPKNTGIWLQENKSKGDIDAQQMKRQLHFDLQTMEYIVALIEDQRVEREELLNHPILGVRYNVIRRPLAGGKHSIRKHAPTKKNILGESDAEFYARLGGLIRDESTEEDGTHFFFMRWKVALSPEDVQRFKFECLDPVLENLLDDYEWWAWAHERDESPFNYFLREEQFPKHCERHYRLPYGIWNSLLEGRSTDLDEYLISGSEVGLERATTLFSELQQ